jgi:hypothetical protein
VGNASGISRGDRNRNARLARLRALVPLENAIVGIDLADKKQMVVVTDHDSRVLARRTFRCRAWDLGVALNWAAERAAAKGFAVVTVSCEPTGHRWRVLGQLAADRSMSFVCVQPMQTSRARRSEDLTFDKTDDKDAVLIARLTAQLRCYVPETPKNEVYERLAAQHHRRFIKTHTPMDGIPIDDRMTYIVVARHPLDMAVSLYHQGNNIDRDRLRALTGQPAPDGPPKPRMPLHNWLLAWIRVDRDPREAMDSLPGVMWHLADAWARRKQPQHPAGALRRPVRRPRRADAPDRESTPHHCPGRALAGTRGGCDLRSYARAVLPAGTRGAWRTEGPGGVLPPWLVRWSGGNC